MKMFKRSIGDDGTQKEHCLRKIPKLAGHEDVSKKTGEIFDSENESLSTAKKIEEETNVQYERQGSELERPSSSFTPDVSPLVIEEGKADVTPEGSVQDQRQGRDLEQPCIPFAPDMDKHVIEKCKADVTLNRKSDGTVEDRIEENSSPMNETKPAGVENKRKVEINVLVDTEDELKKAIALIKDQIKTDPVVALDCEGDDLSRTGDLYLLSISTRKRIFLVDVLKLKSMAFDQGLKDILENENVKKLMFDCREDADALLHQFHVKLAGVLDIQLLEIIKRPQETPARAVYRRCDKLHEVVYLKGLLKCMELFIDNKKLVESKRQKLGQISDWEERPLTNGQIRYAATDVLALFLIFNKLRPTDEENRRLEIASARYIELKRSKVKRTYDEFENNRYLPIDIIPENGNTWFECGNISCTECRRKIPRSEFSNKQMKERTQKCRTCKRVQQDITTEENRQRNFERRDREDLW